MALSPNIILLGFMGSGKTSTGKELARILRFGFIDTDQLIEESIGENISEIFFNHGEFFFREQENKIFSSLNNKEHFVISTGGGIWINGKNREHLLQMGWCIWLRVSAEQSWKRVSSRLAHRPLLNQSSNPYEMIKKIILEREPLYSLAHFSVDTDNKNSKVIAREIVRVLKKVKPFESPGPKK